MTKLSLITLCMLVTGCATQFVGEANFPGGARGCYERCTADNMDMDSFVYMGEYSTACVCRMRGSTTGAQASAGHSGAAVGVVLQQQRQSQQGGIAAVIR